MRAASETTENSESCWALLWNYPHPEDESLVWEAKVTFAQAADSKEFALTLHLEAREMRFRPPELTLRAPRLVADVVSVLDCSAGIDPARTQAIPLRTSDVEDFVKNRLSARGRILPAVVVSQRSFDGQFLVNPDRLALRLVGLATVYILSERGTSYQLTDLMPPKLSCYNGAVRLYWPGFSPDDSPLQHPLYHPDIISKILLQRSTLEDRLFARLARVGAFRYVDGPVTSRVLQASRARQRKRQADELERLRTDLGGKYDVRIAKLQEDLRQRDEYIASLEKENHTLQGQLSDWRLYQRPDTAEVAETEPEVEGIQSVAEAVTRARSAYSDFLDVWPTAIESAAQSDSERCELVYQALEVLHRLARDYFSSGDGGGKVGRFEDYFAPYRIKYSPKESQTTGTKFREQRTFTNGDQTQFMEKHLTIGGGDRRNTVQIFFEIDKQRKKFIVGYCGIHLDYARMRT